MASDRSDFELRALKWKNLYKAIWKVLSALILVGALFLAVAHLIGQEVPMATFVSGSILLSILAVWERYRWYNYQAGLGPPANDPDDYSGP